MITPGGNDVSLQERSRSERGTLGPSLQSKLTARASAALAFITAQNAHRCFPRRCDVARFLDLPHKRQSHRVIEELIRTRYIACTDRGLEIP